MTVIRVLSFDISLTCPGAAVVEVRNGKPRVIAVSHVKPNTKANHALRSDIVESWATLFIAEHASKPFDYVVREDFHGMSSAQNYPVFAAWTGVERATHKFGLTFDKYTVELRGGRKKTTLGMSQSAIKLAVVGKGKAEKTEVANAVRRWTGYDGEFATDDESDSCAVALAKLIREGVIA